MREIDIAYHTIEQLKAKNAELEKSLMKALEQIRFLSDRITQLTIWYKNAQIMIENIHNDTVKGIPLDIVGIIKNYFKRCQGRWVKFDLRLLQKGE